ncbi:glutamine synthetase [Hydrogenivirga caldilitoris]|uniref:Glutamine synthetase n=1 Tax=Hydrogenivirga caldilitoris TaxID=246264 RepID=A0A497XPX9_9AQUI|nr:type I glutamate--ammonia ligase [Hydrogenivirga caldilitoris]RLJ70210.1 glutamine synthetase [Hydrogenivirga caldilitoris]
MPKYSPQEVLSLIEQEGVQYVDLRFSDPFGQWQHLTVPAYEISEDTFESGRGFDGSSIRGWRTINESDMIAKPDPNTAFIDPFIEPKTLVMICDIYDPITGERYGRDTRYVAQKAEQYLKQTGIGDAAYFGPEAEFFIFDSVEFGTGPNYSFWRIDSEEGWWNREFTSTGYKIPFKRGYFPVPPLDKTMDIRNEMVTILSELGVTVELHHHEVATAGQAEIDIRYDSLVSQSDKLFLYKYVVRNVAAKHGKYATFMAKVLPNDNGSGMHTHFSIWKGDEPLFAGSGYAGLSETALYAIGGILKHARAIVALTNPTVNSYHRLVPGFEAPVRLAYSARNRSAAIRIPMYSQSPKAKRIEVRFPDATSNPYLAFSAILMAAIDGIENKIDPGEPFDKDIYSLPPEELEGIPQLPGSLEEAINELEKDYEFLLKGGVFTEELLQLWIEAKRAEVDRLRFTPHPLEFELYFDV